MLNIQSDKNGKNLSFRFLFRYDPYRLRLKNEKNKHNNIIENALAF